MKNDNTQEYMDLVGLIIRKYLPKAKIVLYGSRARREHSHGADIDVAIDNGGRVDKTVFSIIKDAIGDSKLPIMYDIVDYHAVSERMQKEILKDGITWNR